MVGPPTVEALMRARETLKANHVPGPYTAHVPLSMIIPIMRWQLDKRQARRLRRKLGITLREWKRGY